MVKKQQSSEDDGDFWNTGSVDQPGLEEMGTRYREESGAAGRTSGARICGIHHSLAIPQRAFLYLTALLPCVSS